MNYTPKNYRNLKPEAVPTLNLPNKRKIEKSSSERSVRLAKRRKIEENPTQVPISSKNSPDSNIEARENLIKKHDVPIVASTYVCFIRFS